MQQYNITKGDNGTAVTAIIDGQLFLAGPDHPNLHDILDSIADGEDLDADLFDVEQAVRSRFERLSRRVAVRDGKVFLDGDEVDNSLTRQVLRFMRAGLDFQPLVNFFEKVQANPNEHSREQLFDWLRDRDFTIAADGDIFAYKGVTGGFRSSRSGPGIVNGVETNGHLDNSPGNIVEMSRSQVTHNPEVGCSSGLHVANWRYADSWSERTVLVKVDPADVVSVPTDSDWEKVRVCRYEVVREVTEPITDPLA